MCLCWCALGPLCAFSYCVLGKLSQIPANLAARGDCWGRFSGAKRRFFIPLMGTWERVLSQGASLLRLSRQPRLQNYTGISSLPLLEQPPYCAQRVRFYVVVFKPLGSGRWLTEGGRIHLWTPCFECWNCDSALPAGESERLSLQAGWKREKTSIGDSHPYGHISKQQTLISE